MLEIDLDQTLSAAARGDALAWERLVEAYGGRVFGLLLKQCGDRDLAEELTQATFVKLVAKLSDFAGYREQGRFEPWLFRIAMNNLRDEMRRRKRQARPTDMGPGASHDAASGSPWETRLSSAAAVHLAENPAVAAERAEQAARLSLALDQLPEADREVLVLRHTAGLTFAQIAQSLDQPLGTVLARGHRALAKLRKALTEDDLPAESSAE